MFAGFRGPGTSVLLLISMARRDRTVLDPAIAPRTSAAVASTAMATPDFVAIGGKSHNVVWYKVVPGQSQKSVLSHGDPKELCRICVFVKKSEIARNRR